jgi:hypothetical protein
MHEREWDLNTQISKGDATDFQGQTRSQSRRMISDFVHLAFVLVFIHLAYPKICDLRTFRLLQVLVANILKMSYLALSG